MAFRVIAEGTRTANWPDTRCSSRHQRLAAGETQTDIARSYNVSHVTIGRLQGAMLRPFEDAVGSSYEAAEPGSAARSFGLEVVFPPDKS